MRWFRSCCRFPAKRVFALFEQMVRVICYLLQKLYTCETQPDAITTCKTPNSGTNNITDNNNNRRRALQETLDTTTTAVLANNRNKNNDNNSRADSGKYGASSQYATSIAGVSVSPIVPSKSNSTTTFFVSGVIPEPKSSIGNALGSIVISTSPVASRAVLTRRRDTTEASAAPAAVCPCCRDVAVRGAVGDTMTKAEVAL